MNLYSIFDKTARSYSIPFGAVNDFVAKRNFRYTVKVLDRSIIQDLELQLICSFDLEDGSITEFRSSKLIAYPVVDTGVQFLADVESDEKLKEVVNEKSGV